MRAVFSIKVCSINCYITGHILVRRLTRVNHTPASTKLLLIKNRGARDETAPDPEELCHEELGYMMLARDAAALAEPNPY